MPRRLRAIVDDPGFQDAILGLIVLNGLCTGLEAIPVVADRYSTLLFWVFATSQVVFVAEIAARLFAFWPAIRDFFRDGWNTFDFVIVAVSLIPAVGGLTLVARLLRLLRVMRVVSMSDALRGMAGRRSPPSFAVALFLLSNYLLAVAGFHLFGAADPDRWGDLGRAFVSLASLVSPVHAGSVIGSLVGDTPWPLAYVAVVYLVNAGVLLSAVTSLVTKDARTTA